MIPGYLLASLLFGGGWGGPPRGDNSRSKNPQPGWAEDVLVAKGKVEAAKEKRVRKNAKRKGKK